MLPVFSSVSLQHAGSRATAANTSLGRTGPPRVNMSMRTPILLLMVRRNAFPRASAAVFREREFLKGCCYFLLRAERRTFETLAAIRVCTGCCSVICSFSAAVCEAICRSNHSAEAKWALNPCDSWPKKADPEASTQWSKTVVSTVKAVLFLPART